MITQNSKNKFNFWQNVSNLQNLLWLFSKEMLICEYKIYQLVIANDDESQAWQSTNSKLLKVFG